MIRHYFGLQLQVRVITTSQATTPLIVTTTSPVIVTTISPAQIASTTPLIFTTTTPAKVPFRVLKMT
jgi:hypothetical protein